MNQNDQDRQGWVSRILGDKATLSPLAGDGGSRLYFRVNGQNLVLLEGPNPAENLAWLRIGRHLWWLGLPLPRIYHHDLQSGRFLLDDLGDNHLAHAPNNPEGYFLAVELLAKIHQEGLNNFNPAWSYQTKSYHQRMVKEQEINYFGQEILLNFLKWPKLPLGWAKEAQALASLAVPQAPNQVLIHRDFQGRNLLLKGERIWVIDWQGARLGPAAYDLVSLMEETPSGALEPDFKDKVVEHYLQTRKPGPWQKSLRKELSIVAAPRLMQALGAYAKLTLAGKKNYAAYIAPVAKRLAQVFEQPPLKEFDVLRKTVAEAAQSLIALEQLK